MITIQQNEQEAVIYLKDGKRKYGVLIDSETNEAYRFISNGNYNSYKEKQDACFIESVPSALIETIDVCFK